jgi:hypothetical protein
MLNAIDTQAVTNRYNEAEKLLDLMPVSFLIYNFFVMKDTKPLQTHAMF